MNIDNNFKKGFTVIEMFVAIAIFSVFIVSIFGVFTSILSLQREAYATNYLAAQASYALEYMGRQIRDTRELSVLSEDTINIGGKIITLENNRIKFDETWLTPQDIEVIFLKLIDHKEADYERLTLLLYMKSDDHGLLLQQTISLRNP